MAARGVNKVILVGNLGNDPEIRYTQAGAAITNISVATSETWKDKQTGQPQERTEWHRVVFFNRLAEIAGEYLRKGSQVYVEGSIRTRKWQDQSGADRYSTEVVGNEMQMLGGRGGGGGGAGLLRKRPWVRVSRTHPNRVRARNLVEQQEKGLVSWVKKRVFSTSG